MEISEVKLDHIYPITIRKIFSTRDEEYEAAQLQFELNYVSSDTGTDYDRPSVLDIESHSVTVTFDNKGKATYPINSQLSRMGASVAIFGKLLSVVPTIICMYQFYWMCIGDSSIISQLEDEVDKVLGDGTAQKIVNAFSELNS